MVTFGKKAGQNVREDLKRASGQGGEFIRHLRDGKDMRVRFLQDPEDWFAYREHYSETTNFFPCTQDDTCPGCNSDNEKMKKSSRRYAANVLDVAQGHVIVLKIPVDLANRLTNKADRNGGTLLNRDFTLIRTGKGLDTVYDVEAEDKVEMDLSRYALTDPETLLAAQYDEVFGESEKIPF